MLGVGNLKNAAKVMQAYRATQNKLKSVKAVGESKDKTLAILMDGRMELNDVEVRDGFKDLSTKQMSENIKLAFTDAKSRVEKLLKENTSADDLKEMLESFGQ